MDVFGHADSDPLGDPLSMDELFLLAFFTEVLAMATITVRGLDEDVRNALKRRALRHGRSMEAEARQILTEQVAVDLVFPNALVEFHAAMREEPVELEFPERTSEPPRVTF